MSAVVYLVFEIEHSFYLWDDGEGVKAQGVIREQTWNRKLQHNLVRFIEGAQKRRSACLGTCGKCPSEDY